MVKKENQILIVILLLLISLSLIFTGCNSNPKPGPPPPDKKQSAKKEKKVSANWQINVKDTVTVNSKGLPIKYTLKYNAVKKGGTSPLGSYKGTAVMTVAADFSAMPELSNYKVIAVGGGLNGQFSDKGVKLDMGWTTKDKYEEITLAPLSPKDKDQPDLASLVKAELESLTPPEDDPM